MAGPADKLFKYDHGSGTGYWTTGMNPIPPDALSEEAKAAAVPHPAFSLRSAMGGEFPTAPVSFPGDSPPVDPRAATMSHGPLEPRPEREVDWEAALGLHAPRQMPVKGPLKSEPTPPSGEIVKAAPNGPIVKAGPPPSGGAGAGLRITAPIGPLTGAEAKLRAAETEGKQAVGDAASAALHAATARQEFDRERAAGEYQIQKAHNDNAEKLAADKTAKDAAFSQQMDSEFANLDRLAADAANTRIDPKQFWGDLSTGNTIIAALSGLLSVGSARPGVENPWMKVIDKAVNDNIDAQKANLAQKNVAVGQKRAYMADIRDRYQTDAQQSEAARIAALSRVEGELKEMASSPWFTEGLGHATATEAFAKIAADKAKATQNLFDLLVPQWVDLAQTNATIRANVGIANAQNQPVDETDWGQHGLQRIGQGPINPEFVKKAVEGKAGADEMRISLRKLIALRDTLGLLQYAGIDQSASGEADPILADLQAGYTHWKALGAYDKGTKQLMTQMTTDKINDFGFVKTRLESLLKQVNDGTTAKLGDFGFLELPSRVEK